MTDENPGKDGDRTNIRSLCGFQPLHRSGSNHVFTIISIGFCIRSGMKLDAAVPISGKNSRARQEQEAEKAAGGIIEYNNLRGVR